jgi:hypothetical protein
MIQIKDLYCAALVALFHRWPLYRESLRAMHVKCVHFLLLGFGGKEFSLVKVQLRAETKRAVMCPILPQDRAHGWFS